jgi:hypothetical protein
VPDVVWVAESLVLDAPGLVDGLAAVVVGVTLTTCEGVCAGAELVELLPQAVCGVGDEDGVVDGDVTVAAGLLVVAVVVTVVVVVALVVASIAALVVVLEVASGGDDSGVGDPADVAVEAADEAGTLVGGELGGGVALGSRLATLAFS